MVKPPEAIPPLPGTAPRATHMPTVTTQSAASASVDTQAAAVIVPVTRDSAAPEGTYVYVDDDRPPGRSSESRITM
jgi:hypothetical protein